MSSIRLIIMMAVLQCTLLSVPFKGSAQESVVDYTGAWFDAETQTLYVLFRDGNFIFTFINPPAELSIPDWYVRGVWSRDGTEGIELRFPSRASEKQKYTQRIDKLRLIKGELLSVHGHVYVRIEENKDKLRVKPYKEVEE